MKDWQISKMEHLVKKLGNEKVREFLNKLTTSENWTANEIEEAKRRVR